MRAALAAALLACAGCQVSSPPPAYDLILRGGRVLDGSGAAARVADLGIREGRVAQVGDLRGATAERELDARGLHVAPGWIDLHSHADLILLAERGERDRLLSAKIAQGVTTVVVGNCGLGVAPANDEASSLLAGINGWMSPDGVEAGTLSTGDYLDRLERGGVPLNVATLVPHGPLRISAMGLAPGAPSAAQLAAMRESLDGALLQGAFGLSTGLIYPPGMYSDTDELTALAEVVAARGGLFTSHVRGSSETLIEATGELIEIARRSRARVHHSHLEAVGRPFWPEIRRVLEIEDAARAEGLEVSHDVFPYTRAATMMSAIFPPWALEGGVPALLRRLEDPATRERIRREIETREPEWPPWREGGWPHNLVGAVGWDGILVASTASGDDVELVGRSAESIGREKETDPFDVIAGLMLDEKGRVGQLVDEISGRDGEIAPLLEILAHPSAAIVSDAEDYGRGVPHPAHAGAFARALRFNREHRLVPVEELVRRMTGYPAALLGLEERGVIRPGAWADLVVFDAGRVADRATWQEPRLPAEGIRWVSIGGRIVFEEGRFVGNDAGRVLRSPGG